MVGQATRRSSVGAGLADHRSASGGVLRQGSVASAFMQPSDWEYRGLAAESYDLWFGDEPYEDQAFFQRKIAGTGGPALEIACGTGRLLIPFLRDGLDIEGVDSSPAMLDICRRKASRQSLQPVLHQQLMQQLDVPRRYGTIFIPLCSF